jgi:hypothetical protein
LAEEEDFAPLEKKLTRITDKKNSGLEVRYLHSDLEEIFTMKKTANGRTGLLGADKFWWDVPD